MMMGAAAVEILNQKHQYSKFHHYKTRNNGKPKSYWSATGIIVETTTMSSRDTVGHGCTSFSQLAADRRQSMCVCCSQSPRNLNRTRVRVTKNPKHFFQTFLVVFEKIRKTNKTGRNLRLISHGVEPVASVSCLSPVIFSAQARLTSELLRFL